MIVLDASAAVEWLLGRPLASGVAQRLADPNRTLHAPHLLTIEVAQVTRRHTQRGALSAERGRDALRDLADLDVTLYDHQPLLSRIWQLRENVTAYDAAYLALAEVLDATLVTLDERLSRSAGHAAAVDVVA